ncbi:MAG: imidazole glycerol phosphate synthase subunit HisH [Alphaproteobacteria bacterium]
MIAVVDYDRGNLFSIARSLVHVGASYSLTQDVAEIGAADGVILPGVGAFGDAMTALKNRDLVGVLRDVAAAGTPILGICLGMQLLFSRSEEFGETEGLGIISGKVGKLPMQDGGMRVPNVGWRKLCVAREDELLDVSGSDAMFYFVHSYVAFPGDDGEIVATLPINGIDACVMTRRGSVSGCQFHPEKSGLAGLALLARFVASVSAAKDVTRAA